jgi:large subunit ribosomal protein L6
LYGELMSRIGKKPISMPEGVKLEQQGQVIRVSGPLGNLQMNCRAPIEVTVDSSAKQVLVKNGGSQNRYNEQLYGTMRALIANMVTGVSKGYEKKMEIYGTGFNVKTQGDNIVLQVGFCQPVKMTIPQGIKVNIEVPSTRGNDVPARFTLSATDKALLGQFAADIRKINPPEPYKGKGIRFADEHVKRKVGKAFTSGAT